MERNVGGVAEMPTPAVKAHSPKEKMPSEFLAPMLAGARARGIADAYEMMGLGAVLLNDSGRVLHVSARARAMMAGALDVVSDHLIAAAPGANSSIGCAIAAAIGGEENHDDILLETGAGRRISVRVVAVPGEDNSAFQLLKAIVVLSHPGEDTQ